MNEIVFCTYFSEQAYSCEKWKSNESRRLNTSVSGTTWPPSCPAASPWSTPTRRTSPSSTKETGWSDGGRQEDGEEDDRHVQVLPPPHKKKPALHTSPSTSPFYSGKKRNMVVSHFFSVELFYLVISLSCCGLCSEESLHVALVRLSSVQRRVFFCIHSSLHNHTTLFPLDFL